jgi:peptidoglycan/LPS O-acetylase OafA/YrhL
MRRSANGGGASPTLSGIQQLRAIAAATVVVDHVQFDVEHRLWVAGGLPDILASGGAGVDLFFVISGFVMVYASERLFAQRGAARMFLARRIARIVPLYWLMSSVMLAYVLLRGFGPADASPLLALASFVFLPWQRPSGMAGPLYGLGWTLNYEMFFYAVFAAAILARRAVAVATIAGIFLALALANRWLAGVSYLLGYWSDPIILEFVWGMGIALAYRAGLRLPRAVALTLLAAAIAEFCIYIGADVYLPRCIAFGVPAAQAVAALSLIERGLRLPWLERVGDASYALYLTHSAVIAAARLLALKTGLTIAAAAPWLYLGGVVAVSIAVALVVYRFVELPLTAGARALLSAGSRPLPQSV